MMEILKDLPPHVAGFRASGRVSKEDYQKVLIPAVDLAAKKYGKIHFLLFLDTHIKNYTISAWINDLFTGLKHFTKWRKIAIVSRHSIIKRITDVLGYLIPGQAKGFKPVDLDAAKKWVSEN